MDFCFCTPNNDWETKAIGAWLVLYWVGNGDESLWWGSLDASSSSGTISENARIPDEQQPEATRRGCQETKSLYKQTHVRRRSRNRNRIRRRRLLLLGRTLPLGFGFGIFSHSSAGLRCQTSTPYSYREPILEQHTAEKF